MIRAAALGLILFSAPQAVAAQQWAPVTSSDARTVAVGTSWPNGLTAVARCRNDRFTLLFALPDSLNADRASVDYWVDESDRGYPVTWALAGGGRVAQARQPLGLARRLYEGAAVALELTAGGATQRHDLQPVGNPDGLAHVMTACDHSPERYAHTGEPVESPVWLDRPSGADLARLYPRRAAEDLISGEVTMQCIAQASGFLTDCMVISEDPAGVGFGEATLALSSEFRLEAAGQDGRAVEEALITIPVSWRIR